MQKTTDGIDEQFPTADQLTQLQNENREEFEALEILKIRQRQDKVSFNFELTNGWKTELEEKDKLIPFIVNHEHYQIRRIDLYYGSYLNGMVLFDEANFEIARLGYINKNVKRIDFADDEKIVGIKY